jgi:hypothetical protein
MKRIFSAFCLLIISGSVAFSQFEDGEYIQVPELDKYVGTWQWQSGDSVLTIKLAKTILNFKQYMQQSGGDGPDVNKDALIGWHEFRIGSTVKQSSLSSENSIYDYSNVNQTILLWLVSGTDSEEVPFEFLRVAFFRDTIEDVILNQGSFELLEHNQAILSMGGDRDGKFSLPKELVMTKIE